MAKHIDAILIDPFLQLIIKTRIENSLQGLKSAIGDHYIELVRIDDKNDMYIDEEGLFREDQEFFTINGSERMIPIAGYGIIVGSNHRTGNQKDTSLILTDVSKIIRFHSRNEMAIMARTGIFG